MKSVTAKLAMVDSLLPNSLPATCVGARCGHEAMPHTIDRCDSPAYLLLSGVDAYLFPSVSVCVSCSLSLSFSVHFRRHLSYPQDQIRQADEVNRIPLPPIPDKFGVRLPPFRYQTTLPNLQWEAKEDALPQNEASAVRSPPILRMTIASTNDDPTPPSAKARNMPLQPRKAAKIDWSQA